jgi:hypothetical protein
MASKYVREFDEDYDIDLGTVLYLKENLDIRVYLEDILATNYPYPKHKYLYYMVGDERPYKRKDFFTISERRKIIINKFLNNK